MKWYFGSRAKWTKRGPCRSKLQNQHELSANLLTSRRPKRMEPHRSIYSVTTSFDCLQRRDPESLPNQQTHSGGEDTMQTPRDICHWQEEPKPQRDTCVWGSHWTLEPAKLRDFCHWRSCCHVRDISRTWRQRATNKPVWYLAEYIYIGILIRTKAFAINVNIYLFIMA